MPGCVRPRVAVQHHHRLPVAAMPDAQRHIADADMLELEAFEHIYSGSHAHPREGRGRARASLDAQSIPALGPERTPRTDGHGDEQHAELPDTDEQADGDNRQAAHVRPRREEDRREGDQSEA